jgi:histidyl-tRNA synthetase
VYFLFCLKLSYFYIFVENYSEMRIEKPSIPKGTRDFGPQTMAKRKFIFRTIEKVYQKYGFLPLETPSMENLSVLTGKYGDEGDQLIFKILNSGNYLQKAQNLTDYKALTPEISEKALRYDLTVPFARYVVMNRHELHFPFKRYQIQPVWRADRPQKGRYREFYQCDADVIGTNSLLCEAEIIAMLHEVFNNLSLKNFTIKINNRKILRGISEIADCKGKESDLCVAIDKLDKIGKEKVLEELQSKGFNHTSLQNIDPIFSFQGSNSEKLSFLKSFLKSSEEGQKGVEELEQMLALAAKLYTGKLNLELDITLARGLSYYTGAIFEVKANDTEIGSICGGGRYDNLTGLFGLPDLSGVGISFGVDRIFDVMETLSLFPQETIQSSKLLLCHFDEQSYNYCLDLITKIRAAGINSEVYPEISKLKKQLTYANAKDISNVIIIGDEEINSGILGLKNMETGEQTKLSIEEIINTLSV